MGYMKYYSISPYSISEYCQIGSRQVLYHLKSVSKRGVMQMFLVSSPCVLKDFRHKWPWKPPCCDFYPRVWGSLGDVKITHILL